MTRLSLFMELNHHRSGSGEPLVLIHGIGSRWQVWEPVIPRLSEQFEVIALDLPGFGESPMPPAGTAPGAASLTRLVAAFVDRMGVERPHVAGNSLGGLVALQLAVGGHVRSVAALSPAGFASGAERVWAETTLRLSVRSARRLAPRAGALLRSRLARQVLLGQVVGRPARVPPGAAAADLRAFAAAPWFDATLAAIGPMAFTGGDAIDVPVTVGWGERDRLLLPRQARRAARALPRARVVLLHGCGHVPTYDDPEQVAEVLVRAAASG